MYCYDDWLNRLVIVCIWLIVYYTRTLPDISRRRELLNLKTKTKTTLPSKASYSLSLHLTYASRFTNHFQKQRFTKTLFQKYIEIILPPYVEVDTKTIGWKNNVVIQNFFENLCGYIAPRCGVEMEKWRKVVLRKAHCVLVLSQATDNLCDHIYPHMGKGLVT